MLGKNLRLTKYQNKSEDLVNPYREASAWMG
jgi:hypothetical protein